MNAAARPGEPPIVRYRDFNVAGFSFAFASSALLWYAIVNLVS